jgi:hypothetical protein
VGGVAGGIASELVSNFLRGGGLVVRLYDSWCGLAPVLDPPEFILYCFVICLFPPRFFGPICIFQFGPIYVARILTASRYN